MTQDSVEVALIDADILVYRIGYTTQEVGPDELYIVKSRLDEAIHNILKALNTRKYRCYLTGQEKDNFRFDVYPAYKATRTQPKPVHYQLIRDLLIMEHAADVVNGMEADDALGCDQATNTIIVSIDKDLDQIPGWHYNFVKGIKYYVEPEQGMRHFYMQCLTGDRIDNIPGITGVGPKTAAKWLHGLTSEEDLCKEVQRRYLSAYGGTGKDLLRTYGQLLKIRRVKDEPLWEPPFPLETTT